MIPTGMDLTFAPNCVSQDGLQMYRKLCLQDKIKLCAQEGPYLYVQDVHQLFILDGPQMSTHLCNQHIPQLCT